MNRARLLLGGLIVVGLFAAAGALATVRRQGQVALMHADADAVLTDPRLGPPALARGRTVYRAQCAACHGAQGRAGGGNGVPDLTDDDFLYGAGSAAEIETIVLHGIRSGDSRGWDQASMPAYGHATPYAREKLPSLGPAEIGQLASYVRAMNGLPDDPAAVAAGRRLYAGKAGCWDCHGRDATGEPSIGAPNLTDGRWLYGQGGRDDLVRILRDGLHGVSPAFARRLSPEDARSVAVYVASLPPRRKAQRP